MDAAALDSAGAGTTVGLWLARFGGHAALTAVVGFLLVPAWLVREQGSAAGLEPARFGRLAAAAALLAALAGVALFVFSLSSAVARPVPEALTTDLVARFAATRFGATTAVQALGLLVVAGLAAWVRERRSAAVALAAAWLAGLGPAWWGHAGSAEPLALAVASHWVHVVAASAWVGGLATLTLYVARRDGPRLAAPAQRFSQLAGWALGAILVTGMVNTALHVDAPVQLVDTTWGRLAVGKAVALAALAGVGWWHRRRWLPAIRTGEAGSRRGFRRLAAGELVLMVAAFGLATGMASGMPADVEAALAVQSPTTALHDGQVNLTLAPARRGSNEVHLYVFGPDGGPREVDDVSVRLEGPATVEPRLFVAGVGHYTNPVVDVPEAGDYRAEITAVLDGQPHTARVTLTVR